MCLFLSIMMVNFLVNNIVLLANYFKHECRFFKNTPTVMMGRQSGDPFAALLRIVDTHVDRGKGKSINRNRQWSRQAADKQYQVTGGDQGRRQANTVQYTGKVQGRQQRITTGKQSNSNRINNPQENAQR